MIATRFSGRADRYTEQDESRTRAMPNDRVQLRPPRRLLAASAAVCTKTQKLLRVKELDPRVCVIDAFSVCSALSLFFLSRHSSLATRLPRPGRGVFSAPSVLNRSFLLFLLSVPSAFSVCSVLNLFFLSRHSSHATRLPRPGRGVFSAPSVLNRSFPLFSSL